MKLLIAIAALSVVATLAARPAHAACPDPTLPAPEYQSTGPALIVPQSWEVQAGGDVPVPCPAWALSGIETGEMTGFLPTAPTASFQLTGLGPHILMVMSQASCGSVLAVRTGNGAWYFGEAANGRQEAVLWGAPDGQLQVWVGSQDAAGCTGQVILETFDR